MIHLGIISFQSNDSKDLFLKMDVVTDWTRASDEQMTGIEDTSFDSDKPYVNGKRPKPVPVSIEGDTVVINGWFKGSVFPGLFSISIYVEYEENEEPFEREGS